MGCRVEQHVLTELSNMCSFPASSISGSVEMKIDNYLLPEEVKGIGHRSGMIVAYIC